jgi:hypothetical protein
VQLGLAYKFATLHSTNAIGKRTMAQRGRCNSPLMMSLPPHNTQRLRRWSGDTSWAHGWKEKKKLAARVVTLRILIRVRVRWSLGAKTEKVVGILTPNCYHSGIPDRTPAQIQARLRLPYNRNRVPLNPNHHHGGFSHTRQGEHIIATAPPSPISLLLSP